MPPLHEGVGHGAAELVETEARRPGTSIPSPTTTGRSHLVAGTSPGRRWDSQCGAACRAARVAVGQGLNTNADPHERIGAYPTVHCPPTISAFGFPCMPRRTGTRCPLYQERPEDARPPLKGMTGIVRRSAERQRNPIALAIRIGIAISDSDRGRGTERGAIPISDSDSRRKTVTGKIAIAMGTGRLAGTTETGRRRRKR